MNPLLASRPYSFVDNELAEVAAGGAAVPAATSRLCRPRRSWILVENASEPYTSFA